MSRNSSPNRHTSKYKSKLMIQIPFLSKSLLIPSLNDLQINCLFSCGRINILNMVEPTSDKKPYSYGAYLRGLKGMYKEDTTASVDFEANVTDQELKAKYKEYFNVNRPC